MMFRIRIFSASKPCLGTLLTILLLAPTLIGQPSTKPNASQQTSASGSSLAAAPAGPASAPQPSTSSSAHAAQAHVAPALTLQQQIARLPPLTGINLDVKAQSQLILGHLNDILRYYRAATTKIQKAGEPSDILYAEQAKAQATQIAQLAFQSARNEAALLTRVNAPANEPTSTSAGGSTPSQQRFAAARARVMGQIAALQAVDAANDAAIARSNAKTRPPLLQKQEQIDGEFKLLQATLDAVNRIAKFTDTEGGHTGLTGEIERLASSAPELDAGTGKSITAPALENVADTQHSGLVTQASVLFDLLSA